MRLPLPRLCLALALAAAWGALAPVAPAQDRDDLPAFLLDNDFYSDRGEQKKGLMNGNQIALTFFNYGLLGGVGETRGEWPRGSDDFYIGDVLPVVGVEFPVDTDGDGEADTLLVSTVTTRGPRAGIDLEGPDGQQNVFWGFEPKAGFAADAFTSDECVFEDEDGVPVTQNDRPAISTDPCTWPSFWPDQPTWIDPMTGQAQWNGFFGRDQFQADLETYFWMDDVNDEEPTAQAQSVGGTFQADSTRPSLESLGLTMKVRGLQWSQFLAEDAIFWLYEVTNTSTTTYPRVAVGLTVGTLAGGDGDSQDDLAFFDQGNRIVYSWDNDNSGNAGQNVGYVGYGFLESPGDDFNGIDDDGDGDPRFEQGQDFRGLPYISEAEAGDPALNQFRQEDFEGRTFAEGDPVIVIDYDTGERSVEYLPAEGLTVETPLGPIRVEPGTFLEETQRAIQGQLETVVVTEKNLVDEDLDGVVDEDENLHFTRRFQQLDNSIATLEPVRYANYVGFAEATRDRDPTEQDSLNYGLLNPLIDEARDDGVDNDGDWTMEDDLGADGKPATGDEGEGDGVPTPGEPNFDALDVTESDQVGLSSFFYFNPPGRLRMNQDESLWQALSPGFFTTNDELEQQQGSGGVDGDFVFGSGYFRLEPGETLRFSLATVFGEDLRDITNNTQTIQEIYDRNYQFARPPIRPTLGAVPGDGQVTLYWDSKSLDSVDPLNGMDFEGYRIFKSTDVNFNDPDRLSDAFGNETGILVPEFQFDLDNGINGVYTSPDSRLLGVPFPLGEDTGLQFSVVDDDVVNGQRYYYAITAYDRGVAGEIFPAENNLDFDILNDGTVVPGQNVVSVVPNAPVPGFQGGGVVGAAEHVRGPADGTVLTEVLAPALIPDGGTYTVSFGGEGIIADSFYVTNAAADTLARGLIGRSESFVFDGLRLILQNVETQIVSEGFEDERESRRKANATVVQINRIGWTLNGTAVPYDYEVTFADEPVDESIGGFTLGEGNNAPTAVARETFFSVRNLTLDRPATFVLFEPDDNGRFDLGDAIFIYEDVDGDGELDPTFGLSYLGTGPNNGGTEPAAAGDVYRIETVKSFTERDVYRLGTAGPGVDEDAARAQLELIRVVPNPYVAAASWERGLPGNVSGRGERRVDFVNLPEDARVRVYTVRGALVWEGRKEPGIADATLSWDLRTREGLDVAYGVYFYHVESPLGDKTGKIALIK